MNVHDSLSGTAAMPVAPQTHAPQSVNRAARLRGALRAAIAGALTAVLLMIGFAPANAIKSDVTPVDNPAFPAEACKGLNIGMTIDLSNSVTPGQLSQAKTQLVQMVENLQGYPVNFAVHTFGGRSPAQVNGVEVTENQPLPLSSTQTDNAKITNHIKNLKRPGSGRSGYTNWDAAFQALTDSGEKYDLVLFVTDGDPTNYGKDGLSGDGGVTKAALNAGVTSANKLKTAKGSRVVVVGVTDNISETKRAQFEENVSQISGPGKNEDFFASGFNTLQETIINVINDNCATIELTKTGELHEGDNGVADETITYEFEIKNTGVVALSNVTLKDPLLEGAKITYNWPEKEPEKEGVLQPGQKATATATYTVTDDDRALGKRPNTATVTANPPKGQKPVNDEASYEVPLPAAGIELRKSGKLGDSRAGETITYTFTATNTGGQKLFGVEITDPMPGLSELQYEWPGETGVLVPGQSVTATATYTVTQEDVDGGSVDNNAEVVGNPPVGLPVTSRAEANVPFVAAPGIELEKTGSLTEGAHGAPGEVITYTFTATNTGNVTLKDVAIEDPLPGLSELEYQ